MLRSMFSSVVGLRSMQTRMDVIGDNIANVNTPGFKASRVTFSDLFAETLRGASSPGGNTGGSNPIQIGLGTTLASVDQVMSAGTLQLTGRNTDMAIQGNGFFAVSKGQELFFTRAGAFNRDAGGYLVMPGTAMRLQGWMADARGNLPARDLVNLADIRINTGEIMLATATSRVEVGGVLNASAPAGTTVSSSVSLFDSLGREHTVLITYTRPGPAGTWNWSVGNTMPPDPDLPAGTFATGTLAFNPDGSFGSVTASAPATASGDTASLTVAVSGANPLNVSLDFGALAQPAVPGTDSSDVRVLGRDGNAMGALDNFFIDKNGTIYGVFANGQRRALAQVALASFANPEGLLRAGANTYTTTANSGFAQIGEAGSGGRGTIAAANLESANVDLAAEFTNMIVTQRAYQANSRIITASDELLQDLVNIKR